MLAGFQGFVVIARWEGYLRVVGFFPELPWNFPLDRGQWRGLLRMWIDVEENHRGMLRGSRSRP